MAAIGDTDLRCGLRRPDFDIAEIVTHSGSSCGAPFNAHVVPLLGRQRHNTLGIAPILSCMSLK
jgi:hypothetical protein